MNNKKKEINRQHGKVINFLPRKGFGFIRSENGEKIFAHYSDIKGKEYRCLTDGEEVVFSIIDGPKGRQAVDIVRLNPPSSPQIPPDILKNKTW